MLNKNSIYFIILSLKNSLKNHKLNEISQKYDYLNYLSLNKQLIQLNIVNKNLKQLKQELNLKTKILNSFETRQFVILKKKWLQHFNYFFKNQTDEVSKEFNHKKNILEQAYLKNLFFKGSSKIFFVQRKKKLMI